MAVDTRKTQTTSLSDELCPVCGEPIFEEVQRASFLGGGTLKATRDCACIRDRLDNEKRRQREAYEERIVSEVRGGWKMDQPPIVNQTFEAWEHSSQPKMAKAFDVCEKFALGLRARMESGKTRGLLLIGKTNGIGKSHLLNAIANYASLVSRVPAISVEVPVFIDSLRPGRMTDKTREERFEEVKNIPILVLNDLLAIKKSEWALERLFIILEERASGRKVTIASCNENPYTWETGGSSKEDKALYPFRSRVRSRMSGLMDFLLMPDNAQDFREVLRLRGKGQR